MKIRKIFFPKNFYERYSYLGNIPYDNSESLLKSLVIFMDYHAKPKWCPRWFLRLLYSINDSPYIIRNKTLYNIFSKLTKNIRIYEIKRKWASYDVRITLSGNDGINRMVDAITTFIYKEGYKNDVLDKLSKIPELKNQYHNHNPIEDLEKLYYTYKTKLKENDNRATVN